MLIRLEKQKDNATVPIINQSAFNTPAEADLVDVLRKEARPLISLVAEEDGEVVGHILFSPVNLSGKPGLKIMGLGPTAVLPRCQGRGIGSALVRAGLQRCREIGFGAVVVLGHPWFYPRFGFVPSVRYGINSDYEVPEDVFMLTELQPGYLEGAGGTIHYHPAFSRV
jgi:putative acetyltransferase